MIDVVRIKQQIDCRDLIEHDLDKPKLRRKQYNIYKCPLHHEQKGFSLVVYEDHWQCFGKCNRGGDAIAWLQEYHNLTFQEACKELSGGSLRQVPSVSRNRDQTVLKHETPSQPPARDWQFAARRIANQAMDTLWGKAGK
jgi:DNA primase